MRAWARDFVNGKRFKVRVRDYAARNLLSIIHHEDFREESREWLDAKIYGRKDGEPQLRVRDFQKCVLDFCLVAVISVFVHWRLAMYAGVHNKETIKIDVFMQALERYAKNHCCRYLRTVTYFASLLLVKIAGISTTPPSSLTWKRVREESPSTRHTDGCRTWASVGGVTESVSTQTATTAPTTSGGGNVSLRRCRSTRSGQSCAY